MSRPSRLGTRSRRRRTLNWTISLGLLLLLGLGVELLLQQYALRQFESAQQRLTARAGEVRAVLLSELNATLHLATGLASYIGARQGQVHSPSCSPGWMACCARAGISATSAWRRATASPSSTRWPATSARWASTTPTSPSSGRRCSASSPAARRGWTARCNWCRAAGG
ncbi:hypothetical protein I0D68_10110 [Pseudomonas lalucatii]|nr:hypothetical protein [Pseudomonas lalucatii]QVM89004.1 hypothetical protein I0D68_10110 [Pseudomonas lalucatii]